MQISKATMTSGMLVRVPVSILQKDTKRTDNRLPAADRYAFDSLALPISDAEIDAAFASIRCL